MCVYSQKKLKVRWRNFIGTIFKLRYIFQGNFFERSSVLIGVAQTPLQSAHTIFNHTPSVFRG